jgi:1,4-dihydroxy-2-naphthoate octaprenyltransferase
VSLLSRIFSLILLSRAHFLMGGMLLYALGVVVACADGAAPNVLVLGWGLVGVSTIQLLTHLLNEFFDADRDALVTNRTLFSGGSGMIGAGKLSKRVALTGATMSGLVGIVVALSIGWLPRSDSVAGLSFASEVALIYVVAWVIGFGYSAPPLRLMTRGLGEGAAAFVVALLTPMAGFAVASGELSARVVWLGLPLVTASMAFMITVELPDYDVDLCTGKRNWVVRLGRDRSGTLHNALLLLSYFTLAAVSVSGKLPGRVATLLWLTVPLAVWQIGGVWFQKRQGWQHYGFLTVGGLILIGLYALLAGAGFWLQT